MSVESASQGVMIMKHAVPWNTQELLKSPFLSPLWTTISELDTTNFPTLREMNLLLTRRLSPVSVQSGAPLVFVAQNSGKLPFEAQYEPSCYLRGEVPTRAANWHDLFNALVWLTFPKSKAAMNARHYRALTDDVAEYPKAFSSERGAVRDATTLLDESGVIVVSSDPELIGLLKKFEWKNLFWHHRRQVIASMKFFLIGHGLYEKALRPYVGMTGQGMLMEVMEEFHSWSAELQLAHVDTLVANQLADGGNYLHSSELSPVPLLGIPGWSDDNSNPAYYDNTSYFRVGRRNQRAMHK
ncbi:MAG: DUF3025 domain-containing protein [Gallionella sp.]